MCLAFVSLRVFPPTVATIGASMINTIAVMGAGTMGYGIAMNFALAGCTVHLVDMNQEILQRAVANIQNAMRVFEDEGLCTRHACDEALQRVNLYTDKASAVRTADMVIESMPENLELKQQLFLELDTLCKPDCIFVTNTSGLKLGDIMQPLSAERRQYCILAHYFNPAQSIPLVELFALPETLESTVKSIEELYKRSGKVTVRVKKDINGMIGNRIQGAICREALSLLENDVCSGEDLGKVMMFGPCFRYAAMDYLEIIDMGGIDIWYTVYDKLFKELSSAQNASPLLRDKAKAGELGWKTGKGFYSYDEEAKQEVLHRYIRNLAKQLKTSVNYRKDEA